MNVRIPERLAAMENLFEPEVTWEGRCKIVSEAGFNAIYAVSYPFSEYTISRSDSLVETARRNGLRIAAMYINLDLAVGGSPSFLEMIARTGVSRVELSIKDSRDSAGRGIREPTELESVEKILTAVESNGSDICLYPHFGYRIETVAQASELLSQLGRDPKSLCFPLSHILAVTPPAQALEALTTGLSTWKSVNLCGCSRSAASLPSKMHPSPLGTGDIDLEPFAACLADLRKDCDLVIQTHAWNGHPLELLRNSRAWLQAHHL
jgi:sugar phosphate isomerase/epimerase